MFKIICVTDRKQCKGDFEERIARIAAAGVDAVLLREKDLPEEEYALLARKVSDICHSYGVKIILHSYVNVALSLRAPAIHLSFRALSGIKISVFEEIGVSCHSVGEAVAAQRSGCSYVIAGHIFKTDCKKDLPPRGTDFLKEVVGAVSVPVYAIGGINADNIACVSAAEAKGACIMSGFMTCEDPSEYVKILKEKVCRNRINKSII